MFVNLANGGGLLAAILSLAGMAAVDKGYPEWQGILLVLALNLPGVIILMILPNRRVNK